MSNERNKKARKRNLILSDGMLGKSNGPLVELKTGQVTPIMCNSSDWSMHIKNLL